ncbi:MAG: primase [Frankiales bacterium]|nr:primase [Frankiales bacterium]
MTTIDPDLSWMDTPAPEPAAETPADAPVDGLNPADYQPGGPVWWANRAKLEQTDAGNADRLLMDHRRNVRAIVGDRWIIWDGTRWARDDADDGEITRRGLRTIRDIARETEKAPDAFPDDRARIARYAFCLQCQKPGRITDMLKLARVNEHLRITPDELDANPDLLNVATGTINLRTGEQEPHDRDQQHTKHVRIAYDPEATAPTWHAFLDRVFQADADLIAYVQRAFGYSLTGHTGEQALFVTHGRGANGKSVLDTTRQALLGDYALKMDSATLAGSRRAGGEASSDRARLRGARMVTATETSDGMRFDAKLIRELTGGDRIVARELYKSELEFTPIFKLWLTANTLPEFDGSDYAMRRRLVVIPFDVTIPAAERVHDLDKRLHRELPGILNWALAGARDWYRYGLGTCSAVERATDRYGQDMDPVALFLDDNYHRNAHAFTPAAQILGAYNAWASRHGEPTLTAKALANALQRHGLTQHRTKTSRGWKGLAHGLRTAPVTEDDESSREFSEATHVGTPGNNRHQASPLPRNEAAA